MMSGVPPAGLWIIFSFSKEASSCENWGLSVLLVVWLEDRYEEEP